MTLILIGLFFIFISISVGGINFTPAWIGYILVVLGLARTLDCPGRSTAMAVAAGSAVVSGALWVLGLFGRGFLFPVGAIVQIWTAYRLVIWCEEQEPLEGSYHLRRLRLSWYALAGAVAASVLLGFLAPPMGWIWSIVAAAAAVVYIYTFYCLRRVAPPELRD